VHLVQFIHTLEAEQDGAVALRTAIQGAGRQREVIPTDDAVTLLVQLDVGGSFLVQTGGFRVIKPSELTH
jgi:hypothetical protein